MDSMQRLVRKSLPLTARDVEDLAKLREPSEQRRALEAASGVDLEGASEATILRAVWEVGLRAVQERIEDQGYAEIAAHQDATARKMSARRRRPSWTEES